jgi:hypothetical protein
MRKAERAPKRALFVKYRYNHNIILFCIYSVVHTYIQQVGQHICRDVLQEKKWSGVIGENQDHTIFSGSQFFKRAL